MVGTIGKRGKTATKGHRGAPEEDGAMSCTAATPILPYLRT